MNQVILIGHLGRDIEVRYTQSNKAVGSFSIATNRKWKDGNGEWKEEVDWHNIVFWNCENVSQYLVKGKQVAIRGRLQTRKWEDKDGNKRYTTEVVVEQLQLLGGAGSDGNRAPHPGEEDGPAPANKRPPKNSAGGTRTTQTAAAQESFGDEDVPF